jgi:glutathione peroxidase-family protein
VRHVLNWDSNVKTRSEVHDSEEVMLVLWAATQCGFVDRYQNFAL